MSIKRQVKQREPITLNSLRQSLHQQEDDILSDFQALRGLIDKHHIPATVVPNLISASRSLKVSLDHIRAALSIAEDLD